MFIQYVCLGIYKIPHYIEYNDLCAITWDRNLYIKKHFTPKTALIMLPMLVIS